MKNALWLSLGLGLATLVYAPPAEAQRTSLPSKSIGLGLAVQAGGNIDDRDFRNLPGRRYLDDLDGTVGLHVHWDKFVLQKPKGKVTLGLSLGILGRILTWQQETVERRNLLLDTAFRLRFVVGFKRDFAFYVGPAVGPTLVSLLNEDYFADERARPGVNLTFTALGFEWWWSRKNSLFVEFGWAAHWIYHDFDARLSQAAIDIGVNFGR